MSATILPVDADELSNTVLSDLAFASIGDPAAAARIAEDHIGTTILTARTRCDGFWGYGELVVISFPEAGNQLFISGNSDAPAAIDLMNDSERNDDPAFLAALQRAVDAWYLDYDSLGGSLLADPAMVYAA
jgi:hypothetical protein